MTTAIYLRVSSPKGQKTDSQRAELEAWLKRHHYQSVQWFEDHESATTMQRDAFQRLQAAIFAGKAVELPDHKEGVNVLADWSQRGVRIIATTQQIYQHSSMESRREALELMEGVIVGKHRTTSTRKLWFDGGCT